MPEVIHPIARQLLGDSDEPDREMSCCVCGAQTTCPGFIVAAVKTWNEFQRNQSPPIRPSEMGIACEGKCTAELYARRHRAVQAENAQTMAYLAQLFAGHYNADSLAWLRSHGCGAQVSRVLNAAAPAQEYPPRAEPAPQPPPVQRSFEDEVDYNGR